MKRSFKLALLVFTLLYSLAVADVRWHNNAHGVSFNPPAGWNSSSPTDEQELALWESPDLAAEVSISVTDCERGPQEMDLFLKELATSCCGDGGRLVESRKFQVGERELGVVVIEAEQSGYEMISHTAVILAHGKVYYFMGLCQADAYRDLKKVMESASRTLVVE